MTSIADPRTKQAGLPSAIPRVSNASGWRVDCRHLLLLREFPPCIGRNGSFLHHVFFKNKLCNFSIKGGTREWCLVKPTLASPIFFLRWVNTDEHEFYSEHFSQEFPYLSAIRGTRPPSPREVNSRGSSPAVGRFAPSGLLSCFPQIIEVIPIYSVIQGNSEFQG